MTGKHLRFFPNKSVCWFPAGPVHLVSAQDMYLDLKMMRTLFVPAFKTVKVEFSPIWVKASVGPTSFLFNTYLSSSCPGAKLVRAKPSLYWRLIIGSILRCMPVWSGHHLHDHLMSHDCLKKVCSPGLTCPINEMTLRPADLHRLNANSTECKVKTKSRSQGCSDF